MCCTKNSPEPVTASPGTPVPEPFGFVSDHGRMGVLGYTDPLTGITQPEL